MNVKVTPRVEPTESGRVVITFEVDEGNRAGIAAINFTGNNSIDAGTLKSVMRTRETHLLAGCSVTTPIFRSRSKSTRN